MSSIITIDLLGPEVESLNASIGRVLCERILDVPFLPPETSRMGASRSIKPALRSALLAIARDPGAGVGLENIVFVPMVAVPGVAQVGCRYRQRTRW